MLREDCSQHAERNYVYGYTKWRGEVAGFAVAREVGIEFVALQPTIVYGPGAPSWTINPLRMLKSGQVVLLNGGDGICNGVYVDDVVLAMLCAAESKAGAGERYLVSGPEAVTWREFYGAYEAMIGRKSTVSMSLDELDQYRKQQAKKTTNLAQLSALVKDPNVYSRLVRLPMVEWVKASLPRTAIEAAKQIMYGAPKPAGAAIPENQQKPWIHVWSLLDAQFQCRKARVSIEKAERELGYRPFCAFNEGMALTQAWAQWANLLS
jgi:nucleoside-diphosphate-sugar epimerase